jgi:hypothetical protein
VRAELIEVGMAASEVAGDIMRYSSGTGEAQRARHRHGHDAATDAEQPA